MDFLSSKLTELSIAYDDVWRRRDTRLDGYPLMDTPLYTILICTFYVYIVKVAGPKFMEGRQPYNIRTFMVFYNAFQVILSGYLVLQVITRKVCKLIITYKTE